MYIDTDGKTYSIGEINALRQGTYVEAVTEEEDDREE